MVTPSRGRLAQAAIERHRRLAYGSWLLSPWRQRWFLLRHRHAEIVLEGPVRFGPGFAVQMPGPCRLVIGAGVEFRRDCFVEMEWGSELRIGAGTTFTRDVMIQCTREITIGERCLFANGTHVVDSRHRFRDPSVPMAEQGLEAAPLRIGDDVWVAAKATIAADVGDRAVIGAHAAVVRPVEPWTFAAGVPARPVERFGPG